MRGAAHDVGRAHQHAEAGILGSARRFLGGRELGDADALLDRLVDMRDGGVVVAGQHDAALAAGLRNGDAVGGRILRRLRHALLAVVAERLVRHLQLALVVERVGLEPGELALAGRMIHQRGQLDPLVAVELVEGLAGSRPPRPRSADG